MIPKPSRDTRKEREKMKKTFIVIAMFLLVFAISCDGDNPAPGDTPSTSVPVIPESAPDTFTEVPEDQRAAFVSTALGLFPAVFQEEDVMKIMSSDTGGSNETGTVSAVSKQSGDQMTVNFTFNGFKITKLAEQAGMAVTLWGGYNTTGNIDAEDMSKNTASFNLVIQLSGEGFPEGTYHMSGNFSPANESMTIYLNGDPVTSTMPPSSNV